MATQINAWWWRPKKGKNFGDELGVLILKKMGFKVKRVALKHADYILGGTVLDTVIKYANNPKLISVGASWDNVIDKDYDVIFSRGLLTNKNLNKDCLTGDIGLLVSRFYPKHYPVYNIGVVRHLVDTRDYNFADIVIDSSEPAEEVIKKISQCRVIMSSSLHGLIIADSYGIPNMRIYHDEIIGADYKYLDYMSSRYRDINKIQDELLQALQAIV